MAGANTSVATTTTTDCLFSILDPKCLILSQFTDTKNPKFLQLTTDSFITERGPRYKAYADLRESKLRLKAMANLPQVPSKNQVSAYNSTPMVNQLKAPAKRRTGSSILTQSVPNFSSALRKENRKPALPPVAEKSATPPAKSSSRLYEINAKLMGSKSSVSGEKSGRGMLTARKSYANMDELKKFSLVTANAINGENKGGRIIGNRGGGRTTVLGSRQYN